MSTDVMTAQKTFSFFDSLLQGRYSKKLDHNTYLIRRGDAIAIRLHETDIITYTPQSLCILHSGGWNTPTTRDRISAYAPVRMGIRKGTPFITFNGKEYQFFDGITLDLNAGMVIDTNEKPDLDAINAYNKELTKRVDGYVKGLTLDTVQSCLEDMNGDCMFCHLLEVGTGKTLGEATQNTEHLWSHVNEQSYIGSLIIAAYKARGYGNYRVVLQMHLHSWASFGKKELHKNVKRYLMAALWDKNFSLAETEE